VVCLLLAAALLAAGTGLAARQALTEKPPAAEPDRQAPDPKEDARTDLFGDPLPVGALARVGTLRLWHGSQFTALAYAPDGKAVAACGHDSVIRLWDAATGKELRHYQGHKDGVFTLGFSPDGKLLAAGGFGDLLVWRLDADPGQEPRRLAVANDGAGALAFSPDGTLLAAARGQALHVWQVDGWREVLRIDGKGGQKFPHLDGLAFFPDGKTLLTAEEENTIRLWDLTTGKQLRVFGERFKNLWSLALSRDGKTLATVEGHNTLRLWDAASGKEVSSWTGPEYSCYCLAFTPDGKAVAVGGPNEPNEEVRLLDAATAEERYRWACPDHVSRLAFAPDGKTLAVGGSGMIRFREPTTGKDVLPLGGPAGSVATVVFAPDGDTLLTAGHGATIGSWDATTGGAIRPLRGPPRGLTARSMFLWDTAVARDGKRAASVDSKGTLHLWDPRTGEGLLRLSEPPARDIRLALSADGAVLAAVHKDNALRLWDTTTGKPLRQAAVMEPFTSPHAFSPDGKLLATAAAETVQVWDTATLNAVRRLPGSAGQGIACAAFSSGGRFLAVGYHSQPQPGGGAPAVDEVRVWEVATGKEWCRLAEGRSETWSVAFSPDGRLLAEGTSNGEVRLWELAGGGLRRRWEGHRGMVWGVDFAPDGRRLASGANDHTALVWDVTGLLQEGRPRPVALEDGLWADLAGRDAAAAHRAVWALAAAPRQAVPWLTERLRPAAAPEPRQLAQLLADLDSDEFARRAKATEELEGLADLAAPALRRALEGKPPAEVRRRAEQLLHKLEGPTNSPEVLRGVRAVEVLEQAGTPEARQLLERLAKGAPEARLTQEAKATLDRLAKRPAAP
jgi:WD40 repeat protein